MKHVFCTIIGIVIGFIFSGFISSKSNKIPDEVISYSIDNKIEETVEETSLESITDDTKHQIKEKLQIPIEIKKYYSEEENAKVPYFDDTVIKIKNKNGDADVYVKGEYEESINIKYDWDKNQDMQRYFLGKDWAGYHRGQINHYGYCLCQYNGYWGVIDVSIDWINCVVKEIYVKTYDWKYPVDEYDARIYYCNKCGIYEGEKFEFINLANNESVWHWCYM